MDGSSWQRRSAHWQRFEPNLRDINLFVCAEEFLNVKYHQKMLHLIRLVLKTLDLCRKDECSLHIFRFKTSCFKVFRSRVRDLCQLFTSLSLPWRTFQNHSFISPCSASLCAKGCLDVSAFAICLFKHILSVTHFWGQNTDSVLSRKRWFDVHNLHFNLPVVLLLHHQAWSGPDTRWS